MPFLRNPVVYLCAALLLLAVPGHAQVEYRFDRVWPNQVVGEDALTKSVSEVRNTLEKLDGDRKFIQTIPKKGYQWLPEVEGEAEHPVPEARRRKPVGRLPWVASCCMRIARSR